LFQPLVTLCQRQQLSTPEVLGDFTVADQMYL